MLKIVKLRMLSLGYWVNLRIRCNFCARSHRNVILQLLTELADRPIGSKAQSLIFEIQTGQLPVSFLLCLSVCVILSLVLPSEHWHVFLRTWSSWHKLETEGLASAETAPRPLQQPGVAETCSVHQGESKVGPTTCLEAMMLLILCLGSASAQDQTTKARQATSMLFTTSYNILQPCLCDICVLVSCWGTGFQEVSQSSCHHVQFTTQAANCTNEVDYILWRKVAGSLLQHSLGHYTTLEGVLGTAFSRDLKWPCRQKRNKFNWPTKFCEKKAKGQTRQVVLGGTLLFPRSSKEALLISNGDEENRIYFRRYIYCIYIYIYNILQYYLPLQTFKCTGFQETCPSQS